MGLLNKTSWKFLWIFAAIVAVSIAIAYTAVFFGSKDRVSERHNENLQGVVKD